PKAYSYYPGCSLSSTAREYDVSTRLVFKALGLELRELEDWNCCGASAAKGTSHLLGLALPGRVLQLAEEADLPLTTPCPECYSRLRFAAHEMKDEATRRQVSQVLEKEVKNTSVVDPTLKILWEYDGDLPLKKTLDGLKAVAYYGCLFVRPKAVAGFDDEENPRSMDEIVARVGVEMLDWGFRTECCGAYLNIPKPEMVYRLVYRILKGAKTAGADCIVVACPLCQANLDTREKTVEARYGEKFGLPVVYFTQLMGLALGYPPQELLLDKLLIDAMPLLRSKGLA
ncbi:MAG TPA: CoB--CoM heterodisulfide reductase iron-sulfur subunit B family protein, partial [Dehalococcoidia bacterium]|nr:CoB--CoM heterodisulfide reductase iron-sulfur subunit B family protein [Dehalococcoidia bacterium]